MNRIHPVAFQLPHHLPVKNTDVIAGKPDLLCIQRKMRAVIHPRIIRNLTGIADHGDNRKIVERNDRLCTLCMDKRYHLHRQFHVPGVVPALLTEANDFEARFY